MADSFVSVLLPCYNCASTLTEAIFSVCRQTHENWELVICDDGSDDGSLEIANSWAERDKRIRVLPFSHSGIAKTLQLGLEACRFELVARMDGDDISHPRRLASQAAFMEAHPDIAVCGTLVRVFPRPSLTEGMKRYERWLNSLIEHKDIERDIFIESPFVHPSVMFRRSRVLAAGGYCESPWSEDYYLWFRMWLRGEKFGKVPELLFFWRDQPGRLTRTDPRCSHETLRDLKIDMFLRAYYPEYADNSLKVEAEDLRRIASEKRRLFIWGAGPNGKALVKDLKKRGFVPYAYIDIRQDRRGQIICGIPVYGIDQLPAPEGNFLLTAVGNPNSREEIRDYLNDHGWQECEHYRCTAGISS
ncbi:MAG: glycosyltransferase [bacterium]|nr:glycosyltransferase [bacterium]